LLSRRGLSGAFAESAGGAETVYRTDVVALRRTDGVESEQEGLDEVQDRLA
jgi:hypothetical protein